MSVAQAPSRVNDFAIKIATVNGTERDLDWVLADDGLLATRWLADNSNGLDALLEHIAHVDVATSCERAGVSEADVRQAG